MKHTQILLICSLLSGTFCIQAQDPEIDRPMTMVELIEEIKVSLPILREYEQLSKQEIMMFSTSSGSLNPLDETLHTNVAKSRFKFALALIAVEKKIPGAYIGALEFLLRNLRELPAYINIEDHISKTIEVLHKLSEAPEKLGNAPGDSKFLLDLHAISSSHSHLPTFIDTYLVNHVGTIYSGKVREATIQSMNIAREKEAAAADMLKTYVYLPLIDENVAEESNNEMSE